MLTSGNTSKLREVRKDIIPVCKIYKESIRSAISGKMKKCCKCKEIKEFECFGKLKNAVDGLRYDCNDCRKQYREENKVKIAEKQKEYYQKNKESLSEKNKIYRDKNINKINEQRKEYRSRPEIKEQAKIKNKEYLPIRKENVKLRRLTDNCFKIRETLRSKLYKVLNNIGTSFGNILGCSNDILIKWIEFRFDNNMNWDNYGDLWQIDHILPITKFDFNNKNDISICFHWTNLQPLYKCENKSKTNKLELHYYYNNIVNVHRFSQYYKQDGYQAINESLLWLRKKLRYGNNPMYENTKVFEIDNPQPSL